VNWACAAAGASKSKRPKRTGIAFSYRLGAPARLKRNDKTFIKIPPGRGMPGHNALQWKPKTATWQTIRRVSRFVNQRRHHIIAKQVLYKRI
jgi:hypothetical protein